MQSTESSHQLDSDAASRQTGSPRWPGERHPTRWDVHDANESLASTFLERFKSSLLQSEEAQECKSLLSPPGQALLQTPSLPVVAGDLEAVPVRIDNFQVLNESIYTC